MAYDGAEMTGGGHDRLSSLPDDILLVVLQMLISGGDARAAARTSALSRRWRRLPWLHLPHVYLDASNFLQPRSGDTPFKESVDAKLAGVLGIFLAAPRIIESLRLRLYLLLPDEFKLGISELVRAAVEAGAVRDAAFHIIGDGGGSPLDTLSTTYYNEDHGYVFSELRHSSPTVFGCLRELAVEGVWFSTPAEPRILVRRCKALRKLSFRRCYFFPLRVLRVEAPELREMECDGCDVGTIEVADAPELTKLICRQAWLDSKEREPPVKFGHAPSLRELHLEKLDCSSPEQGLGLKTSHVLANANPVQVLRLAFSNDTDWLTPEHPRRLGATFDKLKEFYLHLGCTTPERDLSWTMFLLESAPVLEVFNFDVHNHIPRQKQQQDAMRSKWLPSAGFKHYYLRELRINYSFYVEKKVLPFARLVKERAVNLLIISVDAKSSCQSCNDSSKILPKEKEGDNAQNDVDSSSLHKLKHGFAKLARKLVCEN